MNARLVCCALRRQLRSLLLTFGEELRVVVLAFASERRIVRGAFAFTKFSCLRVLAFAFTFSLISKGADLRRLLFLLTGHGRCVLLELLGETCLMLRQFCSDSCIVCCSFCSNELVVFSTLLRNAPTKGDHLRFKVSALRVRRGGQLAFELCVLLFEFSLFALAACLKLCTADLSLVRQARAFSVYLTSSFVSLYSERSC